MFHNEALIIADLLISGSVKGPPIEAPPADPVVGCLYRVASGASGIFAGHDDALAGYCAGGWRFIQPTEGMRLTDRATGLQISFRSGAWTSGSMDVTEILVDGAKVVGGRQPAIANPTAGTIIDNEVRDAVAEILTALRSHGLIAT